MDHSWSQLMDIQVKLTGCLDRHGDLRGLLALTPILLKTQLLSKVKVSLSTSSPRSSLLNSVSVDQRWVLIDKSVGGVQHFLTVTWGQLGLLI